MTDVPLREYIERILSEHEKEHAREATARDVAFDELQRRLDVLNHAREEAVDDRETFAKQSEVDLRFAEGERERGAIRDWQSKAIGVVIVLAVFAGLIGAAIERLVIKK